MTDVGLARLADVASRSLSRSLDSFEVERKTV